MRSAIFFCLLTALAVAQSAPASAAATLQGQVRLPGGKPAPAGLHLRLEQNGRVVQEQVSQDGSFRFEHLVPGSYTLAMQAPRYPAAVTPVDVSGDRTMRLELDPVSATSTENPWLAPVSGLQVSPAARKQFERARKKINAGDCRAALPYLRKALETDPSYSAAHASAGICYARLNQPDRAEQELRRAVELTTAVYPALNLANLYLRQGRTQQAAELLTAAVQRSPLESDGYYALSLIRFSQNRLPEAEQLAFTASSRPAHTPEAHLLLARIYQRENSADNARIYSELQLYVNEASPGPVRDQIRKMLADGKFDAPRPAAGGRTEAEINSAPAN